VPPLLKCLVSSSIKLSRIQKVGAGTIVQHIPIELEYHKRPSEGGRQLVC